MRIFSTILITVLFPVIAIFALLQWMECAAMAQARISRSEMNLKLTEYLAAVEDGKDVRTRGATLAPGVFCQIHTYRGPQGDGKLVKLFVHDGTTNRLVKIIDQGPEGRGRDIE